MQHFVHNSHSAAIAAAFKLVHGVLKVHAQLGFCLSAIMSVLHNGNGENKEDEATDNGPDRRR